MAGAAEPLYWDDAYAIALLLKRAHPDVEPVSIGAQSLRRWVTSLQGFADDPDGGYAEILDAIQAEWVELEK